ncbi:MAG: hypothetical protein WAK83_19625 [Trebonia sp.]|uniref:hypothetical protein n=1 Tax=Trebonia sp. TaxID=2767075 RepID=UPI003BB06003
MTLPGRVRPVLWLPGGSFANALREAGSSLFTPGFAARSGTEPSAAEFLAAASGVIIVALQIAYLPTLYAAYNRRKTVFLQGWERIISVGFPVERTAEEAWPHFRG